MDLPQISPEHKDIPDEEITPDEVENAINEAHEISALGPSGQTITLTLQTFISGTSRDLRSCHESASLQHEAIIPWPLSVDQE
jgi:hypothetical protein